MKRRGLAYLLSAAMVLTCVPANTLVGFAEEAAAEESVVLEEAGEAEVTEAQDVVEDEMTDAVPVEPVEEEVLELDTEAVTGDTSAAEEVQEESPADLEEISEDEGLLAEEFSGDSIVDDIEIVEEIDENSAEELTSLAAEDFDLENAEKIDIISGKENVLTLTEGTNYFKFEISEELSLVFDQYASVSLSYYDPYDEEWSSTRFDTDDEETDFYRVYSGYQYVLSVESQNGGTLKIRNSSLYNTDESYEIDYGESATLNAAEGEDYTYQWFDQANSKISGAQSSSYVTPALTQNSRFYCLVSDEILTVRILHRVYIRSNITYTSSPSGEVWVDSGSRVPLSVSASTNIPNASLSYTWYDSEDNVVGHGTSYITPAITSDTYYYCKISDAFSTKNVEFSINIKPTMSSILSTMRDLVIGSANSVNVVTAYSKTWFRIVPSVTGSYKIYSTGSVDSMATLYDGDRVLLAQDDDGADDEYNNFSMSVELVAGIPYYLEAGCFGSNTGSFSVYASMGHTHTPQLLSQTAATATKHGTAKYRCTNCGTEFSAVIHNYVAKITTAPTVLATGVKTLTCSVCGHAKTETVAKLAPTISVNATSIPLKVKQSTTKIKVTMGAGDYITSWKSNKPKIAKVNSSGKITGVKKGTAKITVTLASGLSKKITVKVQKTAVKTKKIASVPSKVTLKKKGKYNLAPSITPITTLEKVKYSTANKKIATVSKKGVITAKKKGKVKITVKCGAKKKTITVTVK